MDRLRRGPYWMSSISSLRKITSPGVAATSTPTVEAVVAIGRAQQRGAAHPRRNSRRREGDWRRPPSRALDDGRDWPGDIGGREGAEPLLGHEGDAGGVIRRHAARLARREAPPAARSRESSASTARRAARPRPDRRSAGRAARARRVPPRSGRRAHARKTERARRTLCAAATANSICRPGASARCVAQVEPGGHLRERRNALGEARRDGAGGAVERVEGRDLADRDRRGAAAPRPEPEAERMASRHVIMAEFSSRARSVKFTTFMCNLRDDFAADRRAEASRVCRRRL